MISKAERDEIEMKTRGQRDNPAWIEARKNRLTASTFASICKSRDVKATAKALEKNKDRPLYTKAVLYGQKTESIAIKAYQQVTGINVTPCGLFVNLEHSYIAASPDGVTSDGGIIEVKCPYSAREMTVAEAEKKIKNFYIKDGKLKRTHDYYYQIQGELHCTGAKYCNFIVYTSKDILVERIYPDNELWESKIFPSLE